MWLELLLGLAILIVIDTWFKWRRNQMMLKTGIPSPFHVPLLGAIHELFGNDTSNIFNLLQNWSRKYGKIHWRWMVTDLAMFVQDPKYFESIFRSQKIITKNIIYATLKTWLGEGLLISTGPKWFARRKVITPTFHFKILEQFVDVFDQQGRVMVQRLRSKADGKTVINMFPEVCLTALDIIAETAMGVKINAQEHPDFPYAKAVTEASHLISMRTMKPFDRFDWYYKTFNNKSYTKLNESIKTMHDFTNKVIEDRRRELQKSIEEGPMKTEDPAVDDMGVKKRMAFLDVLLQSTVAGQPLSNEDIREEVDTFMFEGHDTTTSGISFTCYLLSRHPDVQQKVYEEIKEVLGEDKNEPDSMQRLQDLKYLDCVIKESLRLYPPVPIIGRITDQDVELNGKTIPAKTNITILIYSACRDPDYFPQPNEFRPERFLGPEEANSINPFAYVPFSAGARNCIGQKFAILEMKSTVSKMVRNFELLPLGAAVQLEADLILRSSTGINMGLRTRVSETA